MFKTPEVLYSILLISVCVLILVYFKGSLNNLYSIALNYILPSVKINPYNTSVESNTVEMNPIQSDSGIFMSQKVSDDELFNTEYEVTEVADIAISDALKDIDI
tara:strand:+ start:79 stop:390 length:312 start_codon:yes stop_codon:yes gene_type:complete